MATVIEAVYENGVLRPVGPVPLMDRQRVKLTIDPGVGDQFSSKLEHGQGASAPVTTIQPASQCVALGGNACFTTAAEGLPTPTVHWEMSIDEGLTFTSLSDGGVVSGATTTMLTIKGAGPELNRRQFRAVWTNALGTSRSNIAQLSVTGACLAHFPHTEIELPGLLPPEKWDAFSDALDRPTKVIPQLQKLFRSAGVFDG